MGTRLSHITFHPPLYSTGSSGLLQRILDLLGHPLSRIADFLIPARVCHRTGYHVPGHDVFAYETWDLDERYPGYYVGHSCGRCREVV